MVKGLDVFRDHFNGFDHQYVLIGGTAATLAMEEAGLEFRATKDLDVVLHIEAIDPGFGNQLWAFIDRGGYEIRQVSETGRPVLYRFQKPRDGNFPAMLELFCRAPEGIQITAGSHLTPIPVGEAVSSLSAILLNESFYAFIMDGRRVVDGLAWIGAEQLIPLKAHAWLDLSRRKREGEAIDSRDIRKHGNDAMRLSQLLSAESRIDLVPVIATDVSAFLEGLAADTSYDPKQLQIRATTREVIERIALAYGL
jgi:hypothetical protein